MLNFISLSLREYKLKFLHIVAFLCLFLLSLLKNQLEQQVKELLKMCIGCVCFAVGLAGLL